MKLPICLQLRSVAKTEWPNYQMPTLCFCLQYTVLFAMYFTVILTPVQGFALTICSSPTGHFELLWKDNDIYGSYGIQYEDHGLVGCDATRSGKYVRTFHGNLLSPYSGQTELFSSKLSVPSWGHIFPIQKTWKQPNSAILAEHSKQRKITCGYAAQREFHTPNLWTWMILTSLPLFQVTKCF